MTQTSYTILMLLTAMPAWLRQSRKERTTFTATVIQPVLERYATHVQVRFYDAEAFASRCSDFAIFTTDDLQAYAFLIEALRDTALFTVPYFVVNEVLIGLENGYQTFEEASSVQRTSSCSGRLPEQPPWMSTRWRIYLSGCARARCMAFCYP